jgi:hypothetical protein
MPSAEIDDADHGRVRRDRRALRDHQLTDLAVDGRLDLQRRDLALEIAHDLLLAIEALLLGAEIELELLGAEPGVDPRVLERDLGFREQVFGAPQLELGDHTFGVQLAVDVDLALRGLAIDVGLRDHLVGVGAAVLDVELPATERRLQAGKRRLLLRELALQIRARDRGDHLAALDAVARANREVDGARGDRVERRAVRGDHAAIGDDIAHERPAMHGRDSHARAIERSVRHEPRARDVAKAEDEPGSHRGERDPPTPRHRRLGQHAILPGRVADHRRTAIATCMPG